ncbi:MAG: ureidoglycolate lyase [Flexilinea sp.]
MRTIKAKKLSKEDFAKFGDYFDFLNPTGLNLGGFYPDRVLLPVSGNMPVGFSPLIMERPAEYVVKAAEYHNTTQEGILSIDSDIIVHVAPASNKPVPELTEAFIVPKGTFVALHTGVWHMGPFPVDHEKAHILIALPERIYMNDCFVVEYSQEETIKIEL